MVKLISLPKDIKFLGLERRVPSYIKSDLTGFSRGGSIILGFAGMKHNNSFWVCRCQCGGHRLVQAGHISKMNVCKKCDIKTRNWGSLINIAKMKEIEVC